MLSRTDRERSLRIATAIAWLASIASPAFSAPLPFEGHGTHVGVASCARSTCHGAAVAVEKGRVQRNEYTVWQREDAHSNAYRLLGSDDGRRIAANMGLAAATEASECLGCHSDFVPPDRRGSHYRASDGVSCEACHGGADRWLASHTDPSRERTATLAEGLYPLDDPIARARVCLQCHYGSGNRPIDHRIMSAGHPKLSFELDTFTALQPAHFQVDPDYSSRKTTPSGAATWIAGQLVAAEFTLDALSKRFATQGLFPELVFYDCHACHRTLRRTGESDGAMRLADAPLRLTGTILTVLQPSLAAAWQRDVDALAQVGREAPQSVRDVSVRLQRSLRDAQDEVSRRPLTTAQVLALMDAFGEPTALPASLLYAEQISMALGALCNHLVVEQNRGAAALKAPLDAVFSAVRSPAAYNPAKFRSAVTRLRQTVAREFKDRS